MTTSVEQQSRELGRLLILRELAKQPDGRLNSLLLQSQLAAIGIARSREWVHEEMAYLAGLGAILVAHAGSVRIAQLASKGRDHVDRIVAIEGVMRPALPEA